MNLKDESIAPLRLLRSSIIAKTRTNFIIGDWIDSNIWLNIFKTLDFLCLDHGFVCSFAFAKSERTDRIYSFGLCINPFKIRRKFIVSKYGPVKVIRTKPINLYL